ncbi:MAG TPA: hypothetical protein VFS25_22480 [Chitinophaga sp.]|uniref:hypothetical protein n=1 Tax=Chitinophaga sp. TaxID=1869181 RepID=UPI002DB74A07|nr:hypothetical protein [Chitinophaga sp.]HEU4555630.1 hypothetical protein [Chitinophaga sp.]
MKKHLTIIGLAMAFCGLVAVQGTMAHSVAPAGYYQQDTTVKKHKMKDKNKMQKKDWKKRDSTNRRDSVMKR